MMTARNRRRALVMMLASTSIALSSSLAIAQDRTVRIAFLDPLSGPFANIGQNQLQSWQFMARRLSGAKDAAGVKFEVVGFDTKGAPQEALNVLRSASDQGFRYVVQGSGSGVALALADAIAKHNERNPGKEILYLDYGAMDPALTNDNCSYWHFRVDADTSMKMEALAAFMAGHRGVRKVYLLNQDYSHGRQVARYFREGIARRRPDVAIVGDDLHPLGQVKDFAPYAAKIKQSGADALVTGNWGPDLALLVRALNDAGVTIPVYTYYANLVGTPTVLAAGGIKEVYVVSSGHSNHLGDLGQVVSGFRKQLGGDFQIYSIYNGMHLLAAAIEKARSTDPNAVAPAMEGLSFRSFEGDAKMRAVDHQLQQTMFISRWQKAAKGQYSVENTGYTFAAIRRIESHIASTPTSCQMRRPAPR